MNYIEKLVETQMLSKLIVSFLLIAIVFLVLMIAWGIFSEFFPILDPLQLAESIATIGTIVIIATIGAGVGIAAIVLIGQVALDTWRE